MKHRKSIFLHNMPSCENCQGIKYVILSRSIDGIFRFKWELQTFERSRIWICNRLYYKCLPIDSRNPFSLVSLSKLQLLQNPTPRITTRAPLVYHITPILQQQHWSDSESYCMHLRPSITSQPPYPSLLPPHPAPSDPLPPSTSLCPLSAWAPRGAELLATLSAVFSLCKLSLSV